MIHFQDNRKYPTSASEPQNEISRTMTIKALYPASGSNASLLRAHLTLHISITSLTFFIKKAKQFNFSGSIVIEML